MRLCMLTPRLPPAVCGVGDHTVRLARAMKDCDVEVTLVHRQAVDASAHSAGSLYHWRGDRNSLVRLLDDARPDWLWVQLSSYGYSRFGAPASLARALAAVRRVRGHVQIAVYAHETHCQPRQLGSKGFLLSPWQKRTVGAVVRQADAVFTSNPHYVRQIVRDYGLPVERVTELPIGPNVPARCLNVEEKDRVRRALGWKSSDAVAITFGSYASQLRALARCGACLARGVRSGQLQRVVCAGGSGTDAPRDFSNWARELGTGVLNVWGHQPEERIAELIGGSDYAFSPYPPRLLGKSGACSAFALAGLAILAAGEPDRGGPGPALPVLNADGWNWDFARSELVQQTQAATHQYATANYSWELIARRALERLRATAPRLATRRWNQTG